MIKIVVTLTEKHKDEISIHTATQQFGECTEGEAKVAEEIVEAINDLKEEEEMEEDECLDT